MLEVEIQKLTAAVEALTAELRSAKVGNQLPPQTPTETPTETPTNLDKPKRGRPKKEEEPVIEQVEEVAEAADISFAEITQDDVKTIAMEITRADSSARPIIMDILGKRGSKTITHLDPKFYREVHADLLALATDIAKNGEPV